MRSKTVYFFPALLVALAIPIKASAEYYATGEIKGNVCSGFVFESCSFKRIDAVGGDGDQLYTINRRYDSVTEYDASKNRCWIRTKSDGWGVLSWAMNSVTQPDFYHRGDDGKYEVLDVEYLTFKCNRR